MQEFLLSIKSSKHYHWIVLGIKSLIACIGFTLLLMILVKDAGKPFSLATLYQSFVQEQYSLEADAEDHNEPASEDLVLDEESEITTKIQAQVMNLVANTSDKKMHGVGDAIDDSAYVKQTIKVCETYKKFCDLLHFDGEFTHKDTYIYTILSVFFLDKINTNLESSNKKLTDGLESLVLRSHLSDDTSLGACYTERRGCADHHEVIINLELVDSLYGFANVLVHEVGHIVDLGVLEGDATALNQTYTEFNKPAFSLDDPSLAFYSLSFQSETVRKKGVSKEDFCSLYGMTNMFEDFGECFNIYKNHNMYFRVLAATNRTLKKKYQFLANIFGGQYIFADRKRAKETRNTVKKRVRDTTKLME